MFGYHANQKTNHSHLKPRTVFFVKGKQLLKGTLTSNGSVVDEKPLGKASVKTGTYKFEKKMNEYRGTNFCPDLHEAKLAQRSDLIKGVHGGTVLELNAGKGNLTKNVYSGKLSNAVLVDQDKGALQSADRKLDGKIKHELVQSKNIRWLESEPEIKNLKVVDFDPFGSPSQEMKAFFENVKLKQTLYVGITDGSKKFWGSLLNKGYSKCLSRKSKEWLKKTYGIKSADRLSGAREDAVRVLDEFMGNLGRKHGFRVEPVNVGWGRVNAVYAGYKITPK